MYNNKTGLEYLNRTKNYSNGNRVISLKSNTIIVILFGFGCFIGGVWIMSLAGSGSESKLFSTLGLGMLVIGMSAFFFVPGLEAKRRKVIEEEDWKLDYNWPKGYVLLDDLKERLRNGIVVLVISIVFLIVGVMTNFIPFIIIFLFVIFFVGRSVIGLFDENDSLGTSSLELNTRPLPIGKDFKLKFVNYKMKQNFDLVYATLINIQEEVIESRSSDGEHKSSVLHKEMYKEIKLFQVEDGICLMDFVIPEGSLSTKLSAKHARYWVLDIEAKKEDLSFKTSFLLPVYNN